MRRAKTNSKSAGMTLAVLGICGAIACGQSVDSPTVLYRGADVAPYRSSTFDGPSYVYVDVDDGPHAPHSRLTPSETRSALEERLALSTTTPQYLRFAGLARACYRGAKVTQVELILSPTERALPQRRLRLFAVPPRGAAANTTPSFDAPIADRLDDAGRIHLVGAQLKADVQRWLSDRHTNLGWRIECDGELELFASEAEEASARPRLRITLERPRADKDPRTIFDLGVTSIERLDRGPSRRGAFAPTIERASFRGQVVALEVEPQPIARPTLTSGSPLRYVAHVQNHGGEVFEGSIRGRWEIDGVVLERVASPALRLGRHQGARFEFEWKIDAEGVTPFRRLSFVIEPTPEDYCANNNRLERPLLGRGLALRIEEEVRDILAAERNAWGSFSAADIAQWQLELWNETWLGRSRDREFAPDGAHERLVWERIDVVPTGSLDSEAPYLPRADVDDPPGSGVIDSSFDAEIGWPWIATHLSERDAMEGRRKRMLRERAVRCDEDLLRELAIAAHGLIDLRHADPSPRGFEALSGDNKPSGRRFDVAFPSLLGVPGMALGPRDSKNQRLLAPVEVCAINAGLPFRGGPRGAWLYALPERARVRLINGSGRALANAHVDVWQQSAFAFDVDDLVASDLRADENGIVDLPLQATELQMPTRLADGGTLDIRNAFGRLAADGSNATLLLRVRAGRIADWIRVSALDFALPMLAATPRSELEVRVALPVTAVERCAVEAAFLTDGTSIRMLPHLIDGRRLADAHWFRIEDTENLVLDLGEERSIGAVAIVQSRNHGAFLSHFDVEVSASNDFKAAALLWPAEAASFAHNFATRSTVEADEPQTRRLFLGGGPVMGRYLRFRALAGAACDVEEIEVFAVSQR